MSSKQQLILNFYGEKKNIYFPDSYKTLLENISYQIQTTVEECKKNIIISYKDEDNDYILIDNNNDFQEFCKYAINKNNIEIFIDLNENTICILKSKFNDENKNSNDNIFDDIHYTQSIILNNEKEEEENFSDKLFSLIGLNKLKSLFS